MRKCHWASEIPSNLFQTSKIPSESDNVRHKEYYVLYGITQLIKPLVTADSYGRNQCDGQVRFSKGDAYDQGNG